MIFRYIRFVVRHGWLVIAFCCVMTFIAIGIISQAVVASSVAKLFFGDSPDYQEYQKLIKEFASDEIIAVAFEDPNILKPERLTKITRVVRHIKLISEVAEVRSILTVERIRDDGEQITITPYHKLIKQHPEMIAEYEQEIKDDIFYRDLYISSNGKHTAIYIELEPDENRPTERNPGIISEIIAIFQNEGFEPDKLYLAGLQAQLAEIMYQSNINIFGIFPVAIIFLFFTVYALFRHFIPVFITLGIALIAVIWTMAFGIILDKEVNILMAMVPAIILIISFSDVIHLCSAYILELSEGKEKYEAIYKSGSEVGRACYYTSLTTFVGFTSVSFVPTPVFRQIGLVLGTGVAVALLLAMTLVPVIFSLVKPERFVFTGSRGRMKGIVNYLVTLCRTLSTSYPILIITIFFIIILITIYGACKIEVETDFSKRFSEDNHIRIADDFFKNQFAGTNYIDVYLDVGEENGILDPEFLATVSRFQARLEMLPEVDHVVSIVDLIKTFHREINAGTKDEDRSLVGLDLINDFTELPSTHDLVAQYLLIFEMSSENELADLVNFERSKIRLAVRLVNHGFRQTSETGVKIKRLASTTFSKSVSVSINGIAYLLGDWLDNIIAGQRRGLFFAVFTITIMMTIALRSIRVGIISMVPNLFPILAMGGYIGFCWDKVDSDTLMVAMIAIGLGVDDTIHFLNRLRIESFSSHQSKLLYNTFHFTGRAIIQTTVILTFGFIPFIISDYFTTHMLGTLLPLTLIAALIADLLLVPALVKTGIIRFHSGTNSINHQ